MAIFVLFVSCFNKEEASIQNNNWSNKAEHYPYCLEECKAINEKVLYTLDSIFNNSDFFHIKEVSIHFDRKMNDVLIPIFTKEVEGILREKLSFVQSKNPIRFRLYLRKQGNRKELHYDWLPFRAANGGGGSKTTAVGFELEIESTIGNKKVPIVVENWQSSDYRLSQKAAKKEMNVLDFNSKLSCNDSLYVDVNIQFNCINDCFSPKEMQYLTQLGDYFKNGKNLFENQVWNVEKVKSGLIENNLISDSLATGVFLWTEIDSDRWHQKAITIFESKPISEDFLHNWDVCTRTNLYDTDSRFQVEKIIYKFTFR